MADEPSAHNAVPVVRLNKRGQLVGRKGQRTRTRILQMTRRLVETLPVNEITAARIARESYVTIATFYLYFSDVTDALLSLIAEVLEEAPRWDQVFSTPWTAGRAAVEAKRFVEMYIEFHDLRDPIYRVRNLLADQGDPRFLDLRSRQAAPAVKMLIFQMLQRDVDFDGLEFRKAAAAAGVLMGMLERLCAVLRQQKLNRSHGRGDAVTRAWSRPQLIEATAQILYYTIRGVRLGGQGDGL
jgi:AcrR family transcriptional regulator